MKIKTILLSTLLALNLSAITIGEVPKNVTIEGDNGGLVIDGSVWSSSSIKDKAYVMFYVDPDENYPDLKANENVMHLQGTLNELEEQLSAARRAYNQAVTDYNNAIEMIPTNFMASAMAYKRKQVFEIVEAERKNVDVKELFK